MIHFLIYILCYDVWYYFIHRLLHTKYLYYIHKIHHKKYNPDYYDFYTIHILELPIQSMGLLLPIYFYELHIFNLIYAIMFINIRGIMTHDNKFIFLVGNHHLNHHKFIKYNYGEYWLDYLFGTIYMNDKIKNLI